MQIDARTRMAAANAERRIAGAFKAASDATGTSFGYLLTTSGKESDFQPELGSNSSTAKGLFQFLDQTWLELVKREGPSVGLERYASAISSDDKGTYSVADPKMKARILALRSDPLVSSVMAGRFAQENAQKLTDSLGRKPTEGEVYAAHALGPAGAVKLIRLAQTEPGTTAAVAFPKAAAANPGLFYDRTGKPKTAAELLDRLTSPNSAADPKVAQKITEEHAAIARAAATPADPATVARLVAAQAAAQVGTESFAAAETASNPAAALARSRGVFSDRSIPGAASDGLGPGRLDGWRARATNDAFATLMRSDPAAPADTSGDAVAALAASMPGDRPTSGQALVAIADAQARAKTAQTGGIPWVDPNAPLKLAATEPATAASTPTAAVAAATVPTQPIARPSRLMTRATEGAPSMPLPMVDAGRGAVAPSRLLFAAEAGAAPDAVRVTTARVAVPTSPVIAAEPISTTTTVAAAIATAAPPTTTATVTTTTSATAPSATGQATATAGAAQTTATAAAARRQAPPLDLFAANRRPNGR